MANFTTKNVVKALKEIGIVATKIEEGDEMMNEDGAVHISDTRHIQVGCNYAMVVDVSEDAFTFSDEIKTLVQLKKELTKKAA